MTNACGMLMCAGKRISATHPPCKSELMLLCEKFQARFGGRAAESAPGQQQGAPAQQQQQPALILLNEAAIELAVPRRRLYDIINVLEAVEVRAAPMPYRPNSAPCGVTLMSIRQMCTPCTGGASNMGVTTHA